MDLLCALRRSRTRRRTGQPTRCVRTMPPRSPDAARDMRPSPVRMRALRAERSPGGRSPPVSTRCGEGIPPFVARRLPPPVSRSEPRRRRSHWVEHPEESEPGPTHPPSSSEPVEPSWTSEERPSQMTDRSAEPVPRSGRRRRGERAVSRVRGEANCTPVTQRSPRRRSMSDASSSSLSSRRSRRIVPASCRAWQRSFHS